MSNRGHIALSEVPLLMPVMAFTAGVWWGAEWPEYTFNAAAVLAAVFVALYFFRRRALALVALMAAVGAVCFYARYPVQTPAAAGCGEKHVYAGRVTEVRRGLLSSRMIAECGGGVSQGAFRVMLYLHAGLPVVEEGDIVEFSGRPEHMEPEAVPGELTPSAFATRQGVMQVFHLSEGDVRIIKEASGFRTWLAGRRQAFSAAVMECGLDAGAAGFMSAVLTGDSEALSADSRERFARAGVAHMLALSGTHVGVFAFLASWLLFPLMLAGRSRMAVAGSVLLLWGYALLTGAAPPVTRAVIMATAVAFGRMTGRNAVALNSLCAACLLILVWDPMTLFDAGFQLSFAAVASIVLFLPYMMAPGRIWRPVRWAWMLAAVSLAAVAGTAPLAAWHFHSFPLMFLLANMVVAPLLPLLMCGGLLAVLLYGAGWSNGWLCGLIDLLYNAMESVCGWVGSLPGSVVSGIGFPAWLLIPLYGALGAIWLALRRRRMVYAVAAGVLLLFAAGCQWVVIPARNARMTGVFAPWNRYCTAVLAREGRTLYLLTDAPEGMRRRLKEQYEVRYGRFMLENGIDSITASECVADAGHIFADRRCWALGHAVIALQGAGATPILPVRPDVLLVTRGFNGDVAEAVRTSGAPVAVISPGVYGYRRKRFEQELRSAGIRFYGRIDSALVFRSDGI